MRTKDIYAGGSYVEKKSKNSSSLTVRTVDKIADKVVDWSGQTAFWNAQTGRLEIYTHKGSVHIDYFVGDVRGEVK